MTVKEARKIAEAYVSKKYPGKDLSSAYTSLNGNYYATVILDDISDVVLGLPENFMMNFMIDGKTGKVTELMFNECLEKCTVDKAINGTW